MVTRNIEGQTSILNSSFNPAIGVVFDSVLDWTDDGSSEDGVDASLRTFELTFAADIDPTAWAYSTIVWEEEEVEVEEGAMIFEAFDSNFSIKAGRFFVDFGKQMQVHPHDLRTVDRPLVLRTYLGEELGGDGVQFDDWFAAGDSTAVRYSVGVFGSLLGESEEEDAFTPIAFDGDRKEFDELAFTARITAFGDLSSNSQLQGGLSWRGIPSYGFSLEESGSSADDLSNHVLGLDLTWNWMDDTASEIWTAGTEILVSTGDIGAETDDGGTPGDASDDTVTALDDEAFGYYVFGDYQWDRFNSAGIQFSSAELAESGLPDAQEIEAYYSHYFSDFHRIRFSLSHLDVDMPGVDDALRFAIQYTGFLGPHSHGVNW